LDIDIRSEAFWPQQDQWIKLIPWARREKWDARGVAAGRWL